LPQGLPKKIQFYLLLADLAFQLLDPPPRRRQILARFQLQHPKALMRTARRPQRFHATLPEVMNPAVYTPARNL
jgi:hypothetical protein